MINQQMKKNLFIALEGIDGSGKSTQAALLAEHLTNAGYRVYTTFEPTNGMVGGLLRKILKGEMKADERTIAGLFLTDRLDHLLNEETGLVKKMEEGYTVITDRYYLSSYAYHGTHMDMDWVIASNKMCADILRPDVNIFIDVPPDVCMERISANRDSTELYETLDNLKNVREKYLEAFDKTKGEENVLIVDGNRALEVIAEDVWKKLQLSLTFE
jgi:dTMP kinase